MKADESAVVAMLDRTETILDNRQQFSDRHRQQVIQKFLQQTAALTEFQPFDVEISRISAKLARQFAKMWDQIPDDRIKTGDTQFLLLEDAYKDLLAKYERWTGYQERAREILRKAGE